MANFCEELINQSSNPKKIKFLFQTLIKSIKRIDDLWEIKVNNEDPKYTWSFLPTNFFLFIFAF